MVVDLQELARRMLADYDATTPCQVFGEPLDLTTVQAYALQTEIARLREQRGEKVIGYKVGCTSPAVQRQLGIAERSSPGSLTRAASWLASSFPSAASPIWPWRES